MRGKHLTLALIEGSRARQDFACLSVSFYLGACFRLALQLAQEQQDALMVLTTRGVAEPSETVQPHPGRLQDLSKAKLEDYARRTVTELADWYGGSALGVVLYTEPAVAAAFRKMVARLQPKWRCTYPWAGMDPKQRWGWMRRALGLQVVPVRRSAA